MSDDLLSKVARVTVKFGEFTLRSGRTSDHYLDVKNLSAYPAIEKELVERLIRPEVDRKTLDGRNYTCIAGYGLGGQHLASVVGSICEIPATLVREAKKGYGTGKIFEGHEPTEADVVLIIDDVLTSGSSLRETRDLIAPTRAAFNYLVVVNRAKVIPDDLGGKVRWIFSEQELLEAARSRL